MREEVAMSVETGDFNINLSLVQPPPGTQTSSAGSQTVPKGMDAEQEEQEKSKGQRCTKCTGCTNCGGQR